MKTFPTLYKKSSKGKISQWDIASFPGEFIPDTHFTGETLIAASIVTVHGYVGGKLQETTDFITEGKNIGKANETTPYEQAYLEAASKWQKQKDKGYVESIEGAEAGENDNEGGIDPMLAHPFSKHGDKIVYPCYIQPKLDGIRCIATKKDGVVTLWSRKRKPISSVPHIVEELKKVMNNGDILDGELYNHSFKTNFEHIVHLVRQTEPDPQHTDVEYHVYDYASDTTSFASRSFRLNTLLCGVMQEKKLKYVKYVSTFLGDENDAMEWFDVFLGKGYEGAMLRNAESLYENKRSYGLQKVKEFSDEEFTIVGGEEGRGKLSGHLGAFVCVTKDGTEFRTKMSGSQDKLKDYLKNINSFVGKSLTVKFQGVSNKNSVPRFPVGIRIREWCVE